MSNQHEGYLQGSGHCTIFQGWNPWNSSKIGPAKDPRNEQKIHQRTVHEESKPLKWNWKWWINLMGKPEAQLLELAQDQSWTMYKIK